MSICLKNMLYTQIKREQLLKTNLDNVWEFMSSPSNLEKITPDWMLFKITSNNDSEKMYPGMIISYKVTPLLKVPMKWVTKIIDVQEKSSFIDKQMIGPYKLWVHEHIFKKTKKGVVMKDTIRYIPPFGLLGQYSNFLFIKKRVHKIFDYRRDKLDQIFNNQSIY